MTAAREMAVYGDTPFDGIKGSSVYAVPLAGGPRGSPADFQMQMVSRVRAGYSSWLREAATWGLYTRCVNPIDSEGSMTETCWYLASVSKCSRYSLRRLTNSEAFDRCRLHAALAAALASLGSGAADAAVGKQQ